MRTWIDCQLVATGQQQAPTKHTSFVLSVFLQIQYKQNMRWLDLAMFGCNPTHVSSACKLEEGHGCGLYN